MSEKRKKYDRAFRDGAVRIVQETGKPIAQIAREFGVNEGTLGNWVTRDREAGEGRGELTRDDVEVVRFFEDRNGDARSDPALIENPTARVPNRLRDTWCHHLMM